MHAMSRSHPLQPATTSEPAAALQYFTTIHFKGVGGSDELEPVISSARPIPTGGGMVTPPERHRIL
jgi:hypothetical protein